MTLSELTGQESGIVVYRKKVVSAVNWSMAGDDELPVRFGPDPRPFFDSSIRGVFDGAVPHHVDDITTEIPGSIWDTGERDDEGLMLLDTDLDIVLDPDGAFIRLFLSDEKTEGTVYILKNGYKIIAPDEWN